MVTNTTRRSVLGAIAVLPFVGLPAFALTESQATDLVEKMSADIEKTVNSGRPDSVMFKEFGKLMDKYADMGIIAQFSLGPAARSASSSELRAYTSAFKGYIAKKYGQRFREFIGGEIKVKSARADKRGVVVQAQAVIRGSSPVAVDFHTSDRSGSPKVFNVVIEGINLLTTERTEIGALLDKQGGSMSKLTAELKRLS